MLKKNPRVTDPDRTDNSFTLEDNTLYLKGELTVNRLNDILNGIEKVLDKFSGEYLIINLDNLQYIDSAGITAIYYLYDRYSNKELSVEIRGGDDKIREKLELFRMDKAESTLKRSKTPFFEMVGAGVSQVITDYLAGFMQLAADITYWSFIGLFRKKSQRRGEFANQAVLIGVNAVGIVAVLSFIIGLVLALQSAEQLRSFGANIYIVDLTVIAMMSEMGPLITAILVAGRSGSSIAAEIATMKVSSETDALKTMGLNPLRFIMVPKMHGAIATVPFLTIIADVMGIAGGMVIASAALDISPLVFIHRMEEAFYLNDIIFGVIKSMVFAWLIVITGGYFGLRVKGGAEGVGKMTTLAVVVAISLVIIADSIMGLIFY
ncbi:MAG: MlaE family lipid ABC transporter permease subunit [Bacteroidales bacterium]